MDFLEVSSKSAGGRKNLASEIRAKKEASTSAHQYKTSKHQQHQLKRVSKQLHAQI
jgi:hypothetical protein